MHELSLCAAIADIAVRRSGEGQVEVIHVRIGQLRQVVPDTLLFCWSLVTAGTDLDTAALEIERVPAVLRCRACDTEQPLDDRVAFACAGCGSLDVGVIAGEEFLVTALELTKV
jgi:hydrogenase nickel incorporation protein HypA/HybF